MQLKLEEPYLGKGRGGVGVGVLTSGACGERGAGGVEVGLGARAHDGGRRRGRDGGGVRGGVEVRGRGGVESGVRGGVEGVRRVRGDRRATAAAREEEFDLGEVAVGKDERGG